MATIYKFKATFEVIDYNEFTDEDEWVEEVDTITATAETQEEAERIATHKINTSWGPVRHLSFEITKTAEIPPGTIVLQRNLISDCGRYLADGYILIEKEMAFTLEPEEKPFTNPFAGYESRLGQPLGEYAVTPQHTAVFEAGLLWVEYVRRFNKIGVVVCSVNNSEWPAPFALAKDGRYVGVVMPMHGTRDEAKLNTPEQRHQFIELHRESGGVFSQQID